MAKFDGLTEGRIVHYVADGGEHLPAIIVKVTDREEQRVNLHVFPDTRARAARMARGGNVYEKVPHDAEGKREPGTFHGIERA